MDSGRSYCADRGEGTYVNPILYGDYSNPSIIKDGEDYYMVLVFEPHMWHSQDLLHWEPLYEFPYPMTGGAAGLSKHGNTYYIYNICPYMRDDYNYQSSNVWVMTSKDIRSRNWTAPQFVGPAFNIDNDSELIDPDHLTDADGNRWLFMSENYVFPLTPDGLKFAGPGRQMIPDEKFPDDWEIQGVYTEGPRILVKDGYIHLVIAAGGTEGPPTCHGVFAYRAKSVYGPWERSPYNPIIRTYSRKETWHNKGHGQLVEAPDGNWYILYHGSMRDRQNQGFHLLMEPVEWTDDGWWRIPEWSAPDKPLPAPKKGKAVLHGYPTHIRFPERNPLPGEWVYSGDIKERIKNTGEGLEMIGSGTSLHDSRGVLCYTSLYKNFEIATEVTVGNGAGGGIAMYYSPNYSVGFALKDDYTWVFNCKHFNLTRRYNGKRYLWDKIFLKLTVRNQVVSCWFSADGNEWTKLLPSFNIQYICYLAWLPHEVNPLMGNVMYPALFTYGRGKAVFHQFWIKELFIED